MLVGVFALVAAGGLFWLAYRRPRPRRWLLPRRQPAAVRTATGRARSTPKGDDLLSVLTRPLGTDGTEQTGRWVEAAVALRELNRTDALPTVLLCADAAAGLPGGCLLAAEAVGFPNFAAALRDPTRADGRLAVRALTHAARAARDGALDLAALVAAGFGEHLAAVVEAAPADPDPWVAAAVLEAERAARRVGHWARLLPPDARRAADRQGSRLADSADRRRRWLGNLVARLLARFPTAPADEQSAILCVLDDVRADVSPLFPSIPDRRVVWWAEAVRCLRWAAERDYGLALAELGDRLLTARQPGLAAGTVLSALGRVRCPHAERVLLAATTHADGFVRRAALGSLGWDAPFDTPAVVGRLRAARVDGDAADRRTATAALGRFGELAALRELTQGMIAEDPAVRHVALLAVAEEGVSWLWPDLELLADRGDPDAALAAAEALERMREAAVGLLD